ncbi:MAG TPA: right-handed parallel beta-helix repeat-containing protein [Phycisphaerae bacterium]|nr:right-handed parallel beta-helix repeat-containing protein [Phycisphaerae bacterium]
MSGRLRAVDLAIVGALVLSLVSVGSTMLAMGGGGSEQALCAANLSKFGQALAAYEAQQDPDAFPLSDPWPAAPACSEPPSGGDCRYLTSGEQIWDPPHGRLLHQMGYIPNVPTDLPPEVTAWYQWAWGFYWACVVHGRDGVPPVALCPSAILDNVMSETSTEIDFGGSPNGQSWVQTRYKYAACYTPNRLLRSPTCRNGADRRFPRLPGEPFSFENDNMYSTAWVSLTIPGGQGYEYVQGVTSDEIANPAGTLYLCDSRDYRIGNGDELVDPRYGDADISAGMLFALHGPAGTPLGARHNGKSNVLYVDGHVSDDNQTPRNQRGELITASTFADFIDEYGIGTQHHLMPGWRWVDQTLSPPDSYAPGDDEPPTVTAVWPGDQGVSSPHATHITITFSEQVLVNETNVTVNGGAVTADGYEYDTGGPSFSLRFDEPLAAGTYQVTVSDAVTDRMGNQLDGDANGVAGGDYLFEFTVRAAITDIRQGQLQAAVDAAVDGDVLILYPTRYADRVSFQGKAITIRSADPTDPNVVAATIIDADGENRSAVVFAQGEGAEAVLDGVTVKGAGDSGIYIDGAGPTIRRCVIEQCVMDSYADGDGGGVYCMSGWPTIENCTIRDNEAEYGGGMYLVDSAAIVRSNLLQDNEAYEEGGAIYLALSDDLILNNTIVQNASGSGPLGGSVVTCLVGGHTVLASNIFWQNYDPDLVLLDAEPVVACNLFASIPAGYNDFGNIAGDPLFVSGYRPSEYSPCINAGSRWYGPGPEATDLGGGRRISMDRVDMGAYELQAPFFAGGEPAADGTLAKTQNNVVELSFDGTAYLIGPAGLQIVPIGGGVDVGGSFTYELATAVDPNDTLRATENGAVLSNQTWYRLSRGEDLLVETFLLDVCTLRGDANNSSRVTTADYYEVKVHMGEYTDARCDLDGSGRVTTADYSVVKAHLGTRAPTKP